MTDTPEAFDFDTTDAIERHLARPVPTTRDTPEIIVDEQRGLYRKYSVVRLGGTPGKHIGCEYFVLDLEHDEFAVAALRAYANACRGVFPDLAADLRRLVKP